ncbi:hypothetical protein HD806DRAFT_544336 [Xylariaceae sp. AK1471]|nr:hypothetical protein HD806DRAFT_544336 [Xylariaceae sp. AK1471]
MRPQEALQQGLAFIKGLAFAPSTRFESPIEIYKAFISETNHDVPVERIAVNFSGRFATLFAACLIHKDVYQRLNNDAYWNLIQSCWNSPHLMQAQEIKSLVHLVVDARRRYLQITEPNGDAVDRITAPLDSFIRIIDEIDNSRSTRSVRSLVAPNNNTIKERIGRMEGLEDGPIIWPPPYFSPLDIAVLGEQSLRKTLYGINPGLTAEDELEPEYPTDQSDPMAVRQYLSWLALTEQKSGKKVSLLLAPVAFINHDQRQDWHKTTGHKARYYATVNDFMAYTRHEMSRSGTQSKNHVLALMTPWFFDVEQVKRDAETRNQAIPVVWQQTCFRAGVVFALSKLEKQGHAWDYRLVIFKPGPPTYTRAAEPTERRGKQTAWIDSAIAIVKSHFNVVDVWSGGRAERHDALDPARGVPADSVEVSSEFITEVMEDIHNLPKQNHELLDRRFTCIWIKET